MGKGWNRSWWERGRKVDGDNDLGVRFGRKGEGGEVIGLMMVKVGNEVNWVVNNGWGRERDYW